MLAAHKYSDFSETNDVEVVTKVKQQSCRLEVNFIIMKECGRKKGQASLGGRAASYKSRLTSLYGGSVARR